MLIKVRDHYRYSGNYSGVARIGFNLQFKENNHTPIITHNFSG